MNELRKKLSSLQVRENPEERLIKQVMELELIKYQGIQRGDIVEGQEIARAIDRSIQGYVWLYEKGLSMEVSGVKEKLNEEDGQTYEHFLKNFALLQDFMRTHMHLV